MAMSNNDSHDQGIIREKILIEKSVNSWVNTRSRGNEFVLKKS